MNRSSLNVGLSNLKKWHEEKDALRYDLSFQRHTGMILSVTCLTPFSVIPSLSAGTM